MREGESNLVSIGSPVVTYVTNGSNVRAVPNGENIPVGQYQGVPQQDVTFRMTLITTTKDSYVYSGH